MVRWHFQCTCKNMLFCLLVFIVQLQDNVSRGGGHSVYSGLMQLDQVNNEDHTQWVGSRVQSCDGADACTLGLQKGTFIIDIDQQLSDPASRKIFLPYPTSFPLLGLPSDMIGVGPDGGAPSFLSPLHTPGHHAQEMKGGISGPTPPPNTCTAPSCG